MLFKEARDFKVDTSDENKMIKFAMPPQAAGTLKNHVTALRVYMRYATSAYRTPWPVTKEKVYQACSDLQDSEPGASALKNMLSALEFGSSLSTYLT